MASASVSVSEVPEPLSGKFKHSFAYITLKDRLPVILTKVIDWLYRERRLISEIGEEAEEENKIVISRLAQLRNEMVTNKPILPLEGNSLDIPIWNSYLEQQRELYGFPPSWFDSAWLYSECYMYRKIKEAFELSSLLQSYDPFKQQKEESFLSMISGATSLASVLQQSLDEINANENTTLLYEHFVKFVETSLWGNKCDLSITLGKASPLMENSLALDSLRPQIIVNDTETVWNVLQSANYKNNGSVRLDIVLDNAGFELFTDFCLLEFLEAAKLVKSVFIYVKTIPWFVSDTMTSDIHWLLNTLVKQNDPLLANLGNRWNDQFQKGNWTIVEKPFWTLPHDFSEMKSVDFSLYNCLGKSDLVIFKGDLNYRKLTSDRTWNVETPFLTALRGFQPAPLCSFRTIKADVVTGLKPGLKEELDKTNTNWMISGEYAVIQCQPLQI